MKTWKDLRANWRNWWSNESPTPEAANETDDRDHLEIARENLRDLLADDRVPNEVRDALRDDYAQVETMLEKLEHGQIHLVVFGRVSVGKSALVNALLGEQRFATSPLHGETKTIQSEHWETFQDGNIVLIDTPGISEVDGEARERLADDVARRADLVLFVIDSDITQTEYEALRRLALSARPIILVVNKADQYTIEERSELREALLGKTQGLLAPEHLVFTAARPPPRWVIFTDDAGKEHEEQHHTPTDVGALKAQLWETLAQEGKTLAALNASLFAGELSDEIASRILTARRTLGDRIIRTWCIAKGVAVALNPIPVADLIAAATVDISMVIHLSKTYGLPLTRHEAGELVKTIITQMLLLIGTVWAVHLVSSALKLGTSGLSAAVTGVAQAAIAYYSTYVVGQAAERYLANGKSWGDAGPKLAVREILDNIDRESILEQAKRDIAARLKPRAGRA